MIYLQQVDADCAAYDIHDRIDGSHLMKMNFVDLLAVNRRFRFGYFREDCYGKLLGFFADAAGIYNMADVRQTRSFWAVVMAMPMFMAVSMFPKVMVSVFMVSDCLYDCVLPPCP